jgi:hypothetical protein
MKLYDLTQTATALMNALYDEDIDEQTLLDTFESIEWEIEEKADGYAKIMASLDADIDALKDEEKRLSARRKALEGKVEFLKINLTNSMQTLGKTEFKTLLFSFKIQKNPASVRFTVDDETFRKWASNGHDEFLVYKTPEISKATIKDALKDGKDVFGAELVQTESLRIR